MKLLAVAEHCSKKTSFCLVLCDLRVLFVKVIVCIKVVLFERYTCLIGFRPMTCISHLPSFCFQCGLQRTLEHQFSMLNSCILFGNPEITAWVGQYRIDNNSYHIAATTNDSNNCEIKIVQLSQMSLLQNNSNKAVKKIKVTRSIVKSSNSKM